jgi:Lrp/AsnC family transcriptional regulator for asnA, asnC and gidA
VPQQEAPVAIQLDETNLVIIRHLIDGRASFRKIADALGVTENTVRSRVARLVKEDILQISGLVDPERMDDHRLVMVGVKLNTMNLVKKGDEFSRLRGVVSVGVVTGRFDLILTVLLKKGFGLLEFYTEEVSKIQGVRAVETFVVYKSYGMKVPYIH